MEIKICRFSAYAKETRNLKEPTRLLTLQLVIRLPDVRLIWGTLFWWCQPADVIVKEQINTRGRGCMCPQWWGHLLAAFYFSFARLIISSSRSHAPSPAGVAEKHRRKLRWLLACRKLAQIGYSIYCTRLYLSALFLRVLSSSTSLLRPHTNGSSQAPCALITANENTCARSLLNLARLHSTPDNKLVAAGGQISILSWNFT
jgi:hypothetical protein